MRIYGRIDRGSTPFVLASDVKRLAWMAMPEALNLAKLSAYLDGGGGSGQQAVRAAVYDSGSNLLGVSGEVVVADAQAAGWVDFSFGKLFLPQGTLGLVLHGGGPNSGVIRVYGDDPHGMGGLQNADTYADGLSAAFGAATALTADMSIYVTAVKRFIDLPLNETDFYLARLPWAEAQARLALNGPIPRTGQIAQVGWHDTFLDPESGANALVREDSVLAGLLGERVKVTAQGLAQPRSVYVYVHDLVDADALPWEFSVTRHAFAQIGVLAAETLDCVLEIVG